jgi:hypothetical protein
MQPADRGGDLIDGAEPVHRHCVADVFSYGGSALLGLSGVDGPGLIALIRTR